MLRLVVSPSPIPMVLLTRLRFGKRYYLRYCGLRFAARLPTQLPTLLPTYLPCMTAITTAAVPTDGCALWIQRVCAALRQHTRLAGARRARTTRVPHCRTRASGDGVPVAEALPLPSAAPRLNTEPCSPLLLPAAGGGLPRTLSRGRCNLADAPPSLHCADVPVASPVLYLRLCGTLNTAAALLRLGDRVTKQTFAAHQRAVDIDSLAA